MKREPGNPSVHCIPGPALHFAADNRPGRNSPAAPDNPAVRDIPAASDSLAEPGSPAAPDNPVVPDSPAGWNIPGLRSSCRNTRCRNRFPAAYCGHSDSCHYPFRFQWILSLRNGPVAAKERNNSIYNFIIQTLSCKLFFPRLTLDLCL